MHKKTVTKRFFFFMGEGRGGFFRAMTSLAFSSVGIDYQTCFVFACLIAVEIANTYERNDESHAAFAAADDELNSNLTPIQVGALHH